MQGTQVRRRDEEDADGQYRVPLEHMIGGDPVAQMHKDGTSGLDRVTLALQDILGRTVNQNDQVAQLIADINSHLDVVAKVEWGDPRRDEAIKATNSAGETKPAAPQPVLSKAEVIDMLLQRWAGVINHQARIITSLQATAQRLNATL